MSFCSSVILYSTPAGVHALVRGIQMLEIGGTAHCNGWPVQAASPPASRCPFTSPGSLPGPREHGGWERSESVSG